MENLPEEIEREEHELSAEAKRVSEVQERSAGNIAGNIADETTVALPAQADLFRSIGENFRGATLTTTATFALTWGAISQRGITGEKAAEFPYGR